MEGLEIISWRIVTTRIVVTLLDREYYSTLLEWHPSRPNSLGLVTASPLNANHRAALPLGEFQRQVGIWWNQPTARPKSSWNGLWTRNRHSFKSPLRAPHMLSGEFKSRLV